MAYSCTDFVDDVLHDLVIRSWIKPKQYGPDDPQAQCNAVLGAISDADVSLRLAADAKQFHAELLDAVETLTPSPTSTARSPSRMSSISRRPSRRAG
jgi:hypothetical protein